MRFLMRLLLLVVIALGVGFGLSFWALEKGQMFGTVQVGPWVTWPEVGSPNPDPYTRAYMSRNGALELSRAEGLKFVARRDSDGKDLLAECSYRIDGITPETSFWTLVATNTQGLNLGRSGQIMALRGDKVLRSSEGAFALHVGPELATENWLPTSSIGDMLLVLTLYDSSVFSGFSSLSNALPSIFLEGC